MLVSKEICDNLDDREIIRKSLEEVDFFSCLYERYEERLLRYIRRIGAFSDAEAEDILQESFIRIWKNLRAYDPDLRLSSWIYRIVHNQAVSFLRQKKSFGKDRKVAWNEHTYAGLAGDAPEEAGEEPDRAQLIRSVLDRLPLPYREVLVLKFLEEMSYAEISDVLKIPEGTVATRINRAKRAFAELAGKRFPVPGSVAGEPGTEN